MSAPRLLIQGIGDVTIVGFQDSSIIDALMLQDIGTNLSALIEQQDKRKLVLDFGKVRFLSSSALGMLIALKKKADTAKGRIVLCGVRPEIQKVFKIAGLNKMFGFYDDESKALAGFDVYMA